MESCIGEAKRGRKALSKTRAADAEYVRKEFDYHDAANMSNAIRNLRNKYLKALQANNVKLAAAEEQSLAELKSLIDKNQIQLPKRATYWNVHEKDVVKGLNKLFQDGLFVVNGKKIEDKHNDEFKAELAGGSILSDVKVMHASTGCNFFVECKLNLETAEYFKFGLTIDSGKMSYDHKKFLQGEVKHDKKQLKRMNELFDKIDLNGFLNKLLASKEVSGYWKQFHKNIAEVKSFLKSSDEFKDFAMHSIGDTFPKGFKDLAQVFDLYCEHYIAKYNELVDKMFELLHYDDLQKQKEKFKIMKRHSGKAAIEDEVFQTVDSLIAGIKTAEELLKDSIISDKKLFNSYVKQIKVIELKLSALLKDQGIEPTKFNSLNQLKDLNKLMYFFKMFLSSVGRKSKGKYAVIDSQKDEFGNMCICPATEIESQQLAQMITDYYVKKDSCAYIQIADKIFQFDKQSNPLAIEKLPIFKDVMTKYAVRILVNDSLTHISLHINALEPDKKLLTGCNLLSFKQQDANYVGKKLKKIVVG